MDPRRPVPAASACAHAVEGYRAGGARSPGLRVALAAGIAAAALLGLTTVARGEPRLHQAADAAQAAPDPDGFQVDFGLANRRLVDAGESKYFILRPGYQAVLATDPASGARRALGRLLPRAASQTVVTITVLDETREVAGVLTRVVEEREVKDGQLHEVARNFYAIDPQTGDAFYFGEDVTFFEGGRVTGHAGTWLADGDRNRPGLIMPGTPVVGMRYYQEQAPEAAMDRAEVVSTGEPCSTPAGAFEDCLVTRETTPLEPDVAEQKAYAPGIGLVQDASLKLVRYGNVAPAQPRG